MSNDMVSRTRAPRRVWAAAMTVAGALLAAGCSGQGDTGGTFPGGAKTSQEYVQKIDAKIAEIKNDPKIPDAAKQSMIAGLERTKQQTQAAPAEGAKPAGAPK